jgi:hypothetical protein
LVEDGYGELLLASSVNTGAAVRHGVASKVVITLQSFVILSLTYWLAEEYLNNMYLRQYVSDVFAADGLIIGALGFLLFIGSASSLWLVKRRHGGAVSLEITSSSKLKGSTPPKMKMGADENSKPKSPDMSVMPSSDFHPVVAALKADMADRRLSFGSMIGSGSEQPVKLTSVGTEVPKTSVMDQLAPNRQPPVMSPLPGRMGNPPVPRPMPTLPSQQPVGSSVLQTHSTPPPPMPLKITTVITGIVPAKKKDPNAPPEEQPASQ